MTNDCVRTGINNEVYTMKRLSQLCYHKLQKYDMLGSYKICAISQAAGRLSQYRKSIKRGFKTKKPYVRKPYLVNCYGFKLNGMLFSIPFKPRQWINVVLNNHTQKILSQDPTLKVRSFSLTANAQLSLCIRREVEGIECISNVGIDRNLYNVSMGNEERVIQYDLSKTVKIAENTRQITKNPRRNDHRIRKQIQSKYGKRRKNRIHQILHKVSKDIVQSCRQNKQSITFEKLTGLRNMYRKGNNKGKDYRAKLNSFPFYELKRQITYKAQWEGIPVYEVSPHYTSQLCPACGKRTQKDSFRRLYCETCNRSWDRDVVASMNIARKHYSEKNGSRAVSCTTVHNKGLSSETMMGNPQLTTPVVILRVDGSKLDFRDLSTQD